MAFLRTLVFLLGLLFPAAFLGYFWLVGYALLLFLSGREFGSAPAWALLAAYAAASLALAFLLTRRRKLS